MIMTIIAKYSGDISVCQCVSQELDQLPSPKWDPLAWPKYRDRYTTPLFVVLSATILPTLTVLQDNPQIL